ncbi:hypothetical protein Q3G72_019664 [Acer saccharum]|nr:hypothetical protein Q3G72_019664 [Acer saccharum]
MANKGTILIGPWGGPDGKRVDFAPPPGSDTSITEIQIGHANNGGVHFLKFKSFDRKTKLTKESEKWGSGRASEDATASKYETITFRPAEPAEYLTKISGTTAKLNEFKESIVVQSLTFYTNTKIDGNLHLCNRYPRDTSCSLSCSALRYLMIENLSVFYK